mgnify:FL=1
MTLIDDPEDARRRADELARESAPRLPEDRVFRGLRETLESTLMKALNASDVQKRIEGSVQFIAMVSDRLDEIDDPKAKKQSEAFHKMVVNYVRPKFRRYVGSSQDGIPVIVWEGSGDEKTRHQIPPALGVTFDRILSNEALEEHYIRDVMPYVTAAAEIARRHGFLRAEGKKLTAMAFLPDGGPSRSPLPAAVRALIDDELDEEDDEANEADAEDANSDA